MSEFEALFEAAKVGDVARLREILGSAPDLAGRKLSSGETPLMAALYRGHRPAVDVLVALGTPVDLFAAAATGRLTDLSRTLREPGVEAAYSYDGWSALHLAAFFGQPEAATVLLDAGADLNALSRNSLANTALHAATAGRHGDVALLLLARGADDQVADAGGHTPERIASENGLAVVVEAMAARKR